MISSVDSQSSSLTQMFFQNRFPEPKEEPLFSTENSQKSDEGSSASPSRQQSGVEQVNFAQAMQNAAQAKEPPKEERARPDAKNEKSFLEESGATDDAYETLKAKARYNTLFWG